MASENEDESSDGIRIMSDGEKSNSNIQHSSPKKKSDEVVAASTSPQRKQNPKRPRTNTNPPEAAEDEELDKSPLLVGASDESGMGKTDAHINDEQHNTSTTTTTNKKGGNKMKKKQQQDAQNNNACSSSSGLHINYDRSAMFGFGELSHDPIVDYEGATPSVVSCPSASQQWPPKVDVISKLKRTEKAQEEGERCKKRRLLAAREEAAKVAAANGTSSSRESAGDKQKLFLQDEENRQQNKRRKGSSASSNVPPSLGSSLLANVLKQKTKWKGESTQVNNTSMEVEEDERGFLNKSAQGSRLSLDKVPTARGRGSSADLLNATSFLNTSISASSSAIVVDLEQESETITATTLLTGGHLGTDAAGGQRQPTTAGASSSSTTTTTNTNIQLSTTTTSFTSSNSTSITAGLITGPPGATENPTWLHQARALQTQSKYWPPAPGNALDSNLLESMLGVPLTDKEFQKLPPPACQTIHQDAQLPCFVTVFRNVLPDTLCTRLLRQSLYGELRDKFQQQSWWVHGKKGKTPRKTFNWLREDWNTQMKQAADIIEDLVNKERKRKEKAGELYRLCYPPTATSATSKKRKEGKGASKTGGGKRRKTKMNTSTSEEEERNEKQAEQQDQDDSRVAEQEEDNAPTEAETSSTSQSLPAAGPGYYPLPDKWQASYALANWYRDGNDHVGPHQDSLAKLGPCPVIVSLSLGAGREFVLKHRATHEKLSVMLLHGDVCIMWPPCQEEFQHSVPSMPSGPVPHVIQRDGKNKPIEDRINFTFRMERPEYADLTPQCECQANCNLKPELRSWAKWRLDNGKKSKAQAPPKANDHLHQELLQCNIVPGKNFGQYNYRCDPAKDGKPCGFFTVAPWSVKGSSSN
ncbi:unnamed protein product [Amoebophrya sp. A25]|nr:unnamed protein product [Amoebophrya sp. A25]|eukprot:GSA25T00024165001.1